uniref:Uncharacterized protein n=1 Tax=Rhizophora mucronata TaxID=61149 RepID=A0A2P2R4I9_RHIMU
MYHLRSGSRTQSKRKKYTHQERGVVVLGKGKQKN